MLESGMRNTGASDENADTINIAVYDFIDEATNCQP
jgi:hypothetical protein